MKNFVFQIPTTILFGQNTLAAIGAEAAKLGSRALLVYGSGSIKKNGIYRTISRSLAQAGVSVAEHGGVRPNPLLSHVREGIALGRREQVDLVIGVGGGSAMDSAKAIAAGIPAPFDPWRLFTGAKKLSRALPVVTVPTLAATGSEMNGNMVVTNDETRLKVGYGNKLLYPVCSILDPETTLSVPMDHMAYGAVDALSHVLEFYFSAEVRDAPLQDRFMEGLAAVIMESCVKICEDNAAYNPRADLMWAAAVALSGFIGAGLGRVGFPMHLLEHAISGLFDVPHGAGLAVVMRGWLIWQEKVLADRIAQLGHRALGIDSGHPDPARATIGALTDWLRRTGCPVTLDELGVPMEQIGAIADNALALGQYWRGRGRLNHAECMAVLGHCL